MWRHFVSVFVLSLSVASYAQTDVQTDENVEATEERPAETPQEKNFLLVPEISTSVPIFLGLGLRLQYKKHFELTAGYGLTPEPYYNLIASAAAEFGDNPSYEEVVNAAFQNNNLFRFGVQYNRHQHEGWRIGANAYYLESEGESEIDAVLAAATGRDYTTLKNLLIAAGRDTKVDLNGALWIAEIYGAYSWKIQKKFYVVASLGVAKVTKASIDIKTGLPNFEASANGKSLLSSTESELESIITDNGISPTLGVHLQYPF